MSNNYKIIGVKSIKNFDILLDDNFDCKYIFFDIEETVLQTNYYHEVLTDGYFHKIYVKILTKVNLENKNQIKSLGYQFERVLTDKKLPIILEKLKEKGVIIKALTSGFYSEARENQLKKNGIFFDDIIYTEGRPKGPVLYKYVKDNNIIDKIAFIDNHLVKIISVKEFFNDYPISLYWYSLKIENPVRKKGFLKNFIDYWKRVISSK